MFDISTTISRDSFTYFVWTRFDITNPIVYDKNKAIASQDRRLKALHCRLKALKSMSEEIANDFYMTVSEKEEERWSYCQSLPLSSDGMMTHIAAKVIDTSLSFDGAYPTWEKKLIGTTTSRWSNDSVCKGYINCCSYVQYTYLSQPQFRLQQSWKAMYAKRLH